MVGGEYDFKRTIHTGGEYLSTAWSQIDFDGIINQFAQNNLNQAEPN